MQTSTLDFLTCPCCEGELASANQQEEIVTGVVSCTGCGGSFPVLAGVLILVEDVQGYIVEHVKGISRYVDDDGVPKKYRAEFLKAKAAIETGHIEEDLEAERVTALYLMNHYLSSKDMSSPDPVIGELIRKYWDHGPFTRISKMLTARCDGRKQSLVELGCGVGGLYPRLKDQLGSYLGLDSSFASIVLARHFALGMPLKSQRHLVPHDLLQGAVSREVKIASSPRPPGAMADFIVCDLSVPPVKPGLWQMVVALNVIDMLPEPQALARLQYELLIEKGIAIQSCPYVWHSEVAALLRESLPEGLSDSAEAVEYLYRQAGFKIDSAERNVPWLFLKHIRQLEIYSVHLFCASKV